MHILLSSLSGSGLGYGHNAPANINDYLGRLVNFYPTRRKAPFFRAGI